MASGSSRRPTSPSPAPEAAEVGQALGEWKGRRRRARGEDPSCAKGAEDCGRLANIFASLRVSAEAGGFWKKAREARTQNPQCSKLQT